MPERAGRAAVLAAVAGLAYAVLAATESIDALGAPDRSSSVGAVARYYAGSHSVLVFTAVAGALGLFAYGLFAAGLWSWLRTGGGEVTEPWATVGLVGGIGGPVLAGMGQAAQAVLIVRRSTLSPEAIRVLHDLNVVPRTLALLFIALTILGMSTAAFRAGWIPLWVVVPAWALAAYAAVTSGAAFTADHAVQRAVLAAFAAHALWVVAVSAWLLLPRWATLAVDGVAVVGARLIFGAVALAAGVSGLALVAFPGSTPRFFSWGLNPPPLAALIGGFYLASAVVFALALSRPWTEVRGLVAGIVVLAGPVFVVSLVHRHVFDFGRLQAWLWIVFFAAFPLAAAAILVTQRRVRAPVRTPDVAPWTRVTLGVVATGMAAVAVALLASPAQASHWWAFPLPPLGGRVLGGWFLFLAFLGAWAALRGRAREARLEVIALAAFAAGAVLGAARTFDGLAPAGRRAVHIGAAALVLATAAAVGRATFPQAHRRAWVGSRRPSA